MTPSSPGDDSRQGCLARSRRAVKDERLNSVRLDGASEKLTGPEDMGLTDEFMEVPGPHPHGEWARRSARGRLICPGDRRFLRRLS